MFRATGEFDKALDKATSHLIMDPDWPSIMKLCDLIRQNDIQPKYALGAIRKKINASNQHSAMYALLVLESVVKNCGAPVHEELASRQFCETLVELVKITQHEKVREKLLGLIQAWNHAFRKSPKHVALKDAVTALRADGHKFPALIESDAMFSADSAPEWLDGEVCHRCRTSFTLLQRKHHCRACGQVFCGQCSQKTSTIPKYGIEKEVRVCDACYDSISKPSSSSATGGALSTAKLDIESELPAEYLNSSLSQQSQQPKKRTTNEDELREEEELQLALAISQSEAEAKEKAKLKMTNSAFRTVPERSPSPPPQEQANPELAKYLNRSYWESVFNKDGNEEASTDAAPRATSPSAPEITPPITAPSTAPPKLRKENGQESSDHDLEAFISTLKSQVEIFINRMKSNSSRGRSIANDSSVQTLFMNITAMHSKLLRYIQQHDDSRLHFERLQDKLNQVKDARAALDALREEHREKVRREAEEAERLRQMQMAHKLEIMRKKKQEYLQYQQQLALQRIQEQEREMQMRQQHQKQQYLMGGYNMGPPPPPPGFPPGYGSYMPSGPPMSVMQQPATQQGMLHHPQMPQQGLPQPIMQMPPQSVLQQNSMPPQSVMQPAQSVIQRPQSVMQQPQSVMQQPQSVMQQPQSVLQQPVATPMIQQPGAPQMSPVPPLQQQHYYGMPQHPQHPMIMGQQQQPPPSPQQQLNQSQSQMQFQQPVKTEAKTAELISFDD